VSNKTVISTPNAPEAIGPYSQAVKVGNTIYISGQIPLIPETMEIVSGDIKEQTNRVFENLQAIAEASGGSFSKVVKINISLTDLNHFTTVNKIMASYFKPPYPARTCVQVTALPKAADIEIEAIMAL
tara:strand:+ start:1326 stop:1709 length:384 start_codon:yes stop_codon:yes gene_type:complete